MPRRKYKTPPIIEALCELQFNLPDNPNSHHVTVIGKMQSALGADYSGNPGEQRLRSITLTADPAPVPQLETLFRFHLPTADGKRLLAIGPDALSVNVLHPYTTWEDDFRPRIKAALDAYWPIAKPLSVKRIGVRYINRVVVPAAAGDFTNWFNSTAMNTDVPGSRLTHFAHSNESTLPDKTKVIVNHLTIVPDRPQDAAFLLDIDAVWDATPLVDRNEIDSTIEKLHTLEGDVFEALITEATRDIFDA
jgi:uncharacterized protein (TIGR04255 family)